MMGVYFHIPFCRHACHYCDFHFSTKLDAQEELVQAMLKEIALRKEEWSQSEISTVYFGGGTPSLLTESQLGRILEGLAEGLSTAKEITLEANPEDLTPDYLRMLQRLGINRLSIGVQSFFDEHLEYMNRKHSGSQAEAAIKRAQDIGITNITADLIFGIPIATFSQWQSNVEQLIQLDIPHFSAYALTVEEKTVFGARQKKGILEPQVDEEVEKSFLYLDATAKLLGYEHYELSNYAKPGFRSVHNGNYWKGVPYVGMGPSAHSYSEGKRRWNVSNNPQYIRSIELKKEFYEVEELTEVDRWNERIMVGLRTCEGIDWKDFPEEWKKDNERNFLKFVEVGNAEIDENGFRLTPKGWLISDHIISTLFI
ncbi:MAG: radical family heme chaperone HemW [Bacteroidota bacterium]